MVLLRQTFDGPPMAATTGSGCTVKVVEPPLAAALLTVPEGAVTLKVLVPTVAAAGKATVICVALIIVAAAAVAPAKVTVVGFANPVPLMVMVLPEPTQALEVKVVIVGPVA